MRCALALVFASSFAAPIQAQQSASAQQQVMVECRDFGSSGNNYLASNETIINGKACRPAGAPLQVVDSASKLTPAQPATSQPTPPAAPQNPVASPSASVHQGGQSTSPCVILKRMGPADEVTSHIYSFGIRGKQFQFVEGQLPKGVSFHGRLTDHDVRSIEEKGGTVVVIEPHYTPDDIDHARRSCHEK